LKTVGRSKQLMTYAEVKDLKPSAFKRFCGMKTHTFATMLKMLQQREQQKKKQGRTADLSLEDQLLLTLQYWREYRTYFHLSVSWGVSEATVCQTVQRVERALIKAKSSTYRASKRCAPLLSSSLSLWWTPARCPLNDLKNSAAASLARNDGTRSRRNSSLTASASKSSARPTDAGVNTTSSSSNAARCAFLKPPNA
jgi:hypothetical protein